MQIVLICFLPEATLYLTQDNLQKFMPIHNNDYKMIHFVYQDEFDYKSLFLLHHEINQESIFNRNK